MNRWAQITDVVVDEDFGCDVIAVENDGEGTVLLLRPQTHDSAARSIAKLFPYATPDEIAVLVRTHMPDAPRLDDLVRLQVGAYAGAYNYDSIPCLRLVKGPVVVVALVAAMILFGFWMLHQDPSERYMVRPAGITNVSPVVTHGGPSVHVQTQGASRAKKP